MKKFIFILFIAVTSHAENNVQARLECVVSDFKTTQSVIIPLTQKGKAVLNNLNFGEITVRINHINRAYSTKTSAGVRIGGKLVSLAESSEDLRLVYISQDGAIGIVANCCKPSDQSCKEKNPTSQN